MSYDLYRASLNIDNAAMIAALHAKFPNYGKATQSMVNNPEKYGTCLTPEAEALLVQTYGYAPGLVHAKKPRAKAPEKRRKAHRLVVRLDDELYARVTRLMADLGYDSVQKFLEQILSAIIVQMDAREPEE